MRQKEMQIGAIAYKRFDLNGKASNSLMLLLDKLEEFGEPKDFKTLLGEIMEAAREIMDTEASSLMLLDQETGELVVKLPTGPVKDEIEGKRIPKHKGYGGWVVQHRIPLIVNEIDSESEAHWGELSENYRTRNLICAPLLNKENEVIGVIQAVNRYNAEKFYSNDLAVFQALAKHAARAIERNRSREEADGQKGNKDLLISELHHRIKNNLALINGMVEMEGAKLQDHAGKQVLKKIQSRVKSINLVYELLSNKGEFSEIEMGPYLTELVEGISQALSTPVRDITVAVHADEIFLHPDRALSCGLILNELMVNSYKHAFKYKSEGSITIYLTREDETITLKYQDDGIGMPEDFDPDEYASLGFKIIESLTSKLDGTFSFDKRDGHKGVHCTLQFPAS